MNAVVAQARAAWANRRTVAGNVNGKAVTWPIGVAPSLPLGPAWPATVDYASGPAQNTVNWSSVSGASGYNVYKMVGHETALPDPAIPIVSNTASTSTAAAASATASHCSSASLSR